jgi:hypothetical protein
LNSRDIIITIFLLIPFEICSNSIAILKENKVVGDIDKSSNNSVDDCPRGKIPLNDCPRCCHSVSVSERKEFFNTNTVWFCRYPDIVNLNMLQPEDLK